jgi:hypothetical protein
MNFGPLELISVGIVIGLVITISFIAATFLIRLRRPRP